MRQPDLFETLGKFQQLQLKLQEIVRDIKNPTQFDYLRKIKATVAVMQKAEADVRAYRKEKQRKLEEIQELRGDWENKIEIFRLRFTTEMNSWCHRR